MEDDLDRIAAGDESAYAWLHRFYFGTASGACSISSQDLGAIDAREVSSIEIPATASSCASAATARTSSATGSAPTSPPTSSPTS